MEYFEYNRGRNYLDRMSNKTVWYFIEFIKNSDKLNPKEKDILINRVKGKSLSQIGKKFKLTGERIRQKEEVAILKLMKKIYQMILFESSSN